MKYFTKVNMAILYSKYDTLLLKIFSISDSSEGDVQMKQFSSQSTLFEKIWMITSSSLKGFSQVLLVNNALSGLLILIGITIHSPLLGLMAFLSSVVGTLTGTYFGGDKLKIQEGIYSFNAILTGIAAMLFLTNEMRWLVALLLAMVASLLMVALSKTFARWKIPILTLPFVVVTWIGLLFSYMIKAMHIKS